MTCSEKAISNMARVNFEDMVNWTNGSVMGLTVHQYIMWPHLSLAAGQFLIAIMCSTTR